MFEKRSPKGRFFIILAFKLKQMKKIFTAFLILTVSTVWAQNTAIAYLPKEEKKEIYGFHTVKMDTLYLKNDQVGELIRQTWDDKRYAATKPVIIMTDDIYAVMERYKNKPNKKKTVKN